jgi:hypothetical protein
LAAAAAVLLRIFSHPVILGPRGRSSPTDNDVVVVARVVMAVRITRPIPSIIKKVDFVLDVAALSESVARRCERGPV